jgi:uncharacterized lipoprotein YajG
MKIKSSDGSKKPALAVKLLILIGATALLAGCETTSHPSAAVSPDFPPAPLTHQSSP